jgi:MFS transporter, NNP family, nitrate/nitrite transporter
MNIFTRALGGWAGDMVYSCYGVPGKKYLTIACGLLQGVLAIDWGFYIDSRTDPSRENTALLSETLKTQFNYSGNIHSSHGALRRFQRSWEWRELCSRSSLQS